MKKQINFILFFIFWWLTLTAAQENNLSLTDKDLKIQRYFAQQTVLNKSTDPFTPFYFEKGQLALLSYRYQLAFMGYAIATAAVKTPAYRDLSQKILKHIITMMLDKKVWDYVEHYWKNTTTFPDPVIYENIMYSGHLAQLLVLYQALFNDNYYDTTGFDFVWDEKTKIHYTTKKLLQVMKKQVEDELSGGIPCEPNTVFVPCNDHPHIAFLLYDKINGTNFAKCSLKWKKFMEAQFPFKDTSRGLFKVSYFKHTKSFAPFPVPGLDGWSLAWMYPWLDDLNFVKNSWEKVKQNKNWIDKDNKLHLRLTIMDKTMNVDEALAAVFFPLVANQMEGQNSEFAKKIINWYEEKFAKEDDLNGDGINESFYYDSGANKILITAIIATALLTNKDSLRQMYQNPYAKSFFKKPYLKEINYPQVYVKKANYENKNLVVEIVKGDGKLNDNIKLVFANVKKVNKILKNNQEIKNYKLEKNILTIETKLEEKNKFKLEIE